MGRTVMAARASGSNNAKAMNSIEVIDRLVCECANMDESLVIESHSNSSSHQAEKLAANVCR